MPSNLRRIACPTVVFHPTCCSNAPIARGQTADTSSIRSITSRVKNRRCSTPRAGPTTGSIRAAKVPNVLAAQRFCDVLTAVYGIGDTIDSASQTLSVLRLPANFVSAND